MSCFPRISLILFLFLQELISLYMPLFARADDMSSQPISLSPIVVAPTGNPTPQNQVGSDVTVITAEEIKKSQRVTVADLLQDVPGLNVVQTGGPGGTTSVYIWGGQSNMVKVLVDGVDVTDPSTPGMTAHFGQMLTSDIQQIEILRGPQSGLYGSDAMAGVISITTKKGNGPVKITGDIEGGSFGTFNQTLGVSGSLGKTGSTGNTNYDFNAAHFYSGDTPVYPSEFAPTGVSIQGQAYNNYTLSSRIDTTILPNFDAGLTAHYVDSLLNYNNFNATTGTTLEPLQSQQYMQQFFGSIFAHLVLFHGTWDQTLTLGYYDALTTYLDPNAGASIPWSEYQGGRLREDWINKVKLSFKNLLTVGLEHELDTMYTTSPVISPEWANSAVFSQLQSTIGQSFFNAVNVRYDTNSIYGGAFTFREAPGYTFHQTGTTLRGSVGTGYMVPTLQELYLSFPQFGFFANPNLQPETSLGYDVGIDQSLLKNRLKFGGTLFQNDFNNLIQIGAIPGQQFESTYFNIGKSLSYGAELYTSFQPLRSLTLRVDYTYTFSENTLNDTELLRVPSDKVSFTTDWQPTNKFSFTSMFLYVGPWADVGATGIPAYVMADGYTLMDVTANYMPKKWLTLYARIDNLFNDIYQNPVGFLQPGFGAYGGLRVSMGG